MEKSSRYLMRIIAAIVVATFYFGLPYVEKDTNEVAHKRDIIVITILVMLFILNVRQYFKAKAIEGN